MSHTAFCALCKFNYLHHERIRSIADYLSLRVYYNTCCLPLNTKVVCASAGRCLFVSAREHGRLWMLRNGEPYFVITPNGKALWMAAVVNWTTNKHHSPPGACDFVQTGVCRAAPTQHGRHFIILVRMQCVGYGKKSSITPNPIRINIIKRAARLLLENDGTPHA